MAGDVTVAVVSKQLSTSGTGTTDFTKSGFGTPKACIIIMTEDETDGTTVSVQSRLSIGFSDFTNHRCITHQDEDASAKVDCDALKSATKAYVILDVGASVIIDGTAGTGVTDGVRLTNTTNTNADDPFATVIMFSGADPVDDLRSTTINSSQDGTATITHAGLTDGNEKFIFFIGTDIAAEDSANTGIGNSFGVCHVSGNDAGGYTFTQRCMGWASDHNNNDGSPHDIISTDRVLDIITEAGGQDWGLEVTAFSSSGNTITVTTRDAGAGAGMEVYSLVIDLDDRKAKVGSVDAPFSGTSWTPSVALGFTPQYVGIGLTMIEAENTIDNGFPGSIGISSNTGSGEETCHSWYNQDNAAITNTNNLFRSRVIDQRNPTTNSVVQDHSHSSFNDGDWTYTINSESAIVARKWFYWAMEEAATPGITRSPDVGSVVITGQAPLNFLNRIPQPASGAVLITGQVPIADVRVDIPVSVGAVVITGQAPLNFLNIIPQPGVGSIVINGQVPLSIKAELTQPSTGSILITGQTPINHIGVIKVPGTGSVVINGQVPLNLLNIISQPSTGPVVIIGFAPLVIAGDELIEPGTGSVVIAGQAPNMAFAISTPVGSIVITGQVPTIDITVLTLPGTGSVVINGQVPLSIKTELVQPGTGSIVITGFVPAVAGEGAIPVPAGSVVLTGQVPLNLLNRIPLPGAGNIAISGQTPTLVFDLVKSPASGSITLAGQAPTVNVLLAVTVTPATGSIAIVGAVPTIISPIQVAGVSATGNVGFYNAFVWNHILRVA